LLAIGPPPYPASSLWTERTWLQTFKGQLRAGALWNMARDFLEVPELSIFDLPNLLRGFRFSLFAMWDEASRLNLIEAVPALKVPVFFFLGRQDHWVPPETSVDRQASDVQPTGSDPCTFSGLANNSLERTQPQLGFMYDVRVLRRSARSR
jgi:pimeloyl-ACP methyl ester carboxylesterase